MSLISWHLSRLRRVARSSSAAETQAAADGDDEAVYNRLCLKEVLFGQLELRNWQSETRQIHTSVVMDCRGVYDALARSSSSCLGLKDKKSGLEAHALKHSLVECGRAMRWCHSAAQLCGVVTKDYDAARALWELFVRRGFRWKLIHDPKFESSRNRPKRGLDTLDEPDENEFADDSPRDPTIQLFRMHTCSELSFPASEATDPEHRDASVLLPCVRNHWMLSYQFRAS